MKNLIVKVVLVVGLFTFIFGSTGCSKQPNPVENEVKFSTYTQSERKEYIKNYFQEEYGITCVVSDVKQKQETAIKNEDYYFATATTPDDEIISVWISTSGEIVDSYFLLQNSEIIQAEFENEIRRVIPEFRIKTYSEMREIPQSVFSANDVRGFLENEDVFSYIRVFVDDSRNIDDACVEEIAEKLGFCDASLYVYVCENIDDVNFSTYDLSAYDFSRSIEKGK